MRGAERERRERERAQRYLGAWTDPPTSSHGGAKRDYIALVTLTPAGHGDAIFDPAVPVFDSSTHTVTRRRCGRDTIKRSPFFGEVRGVLGSEVSSWARLIDVKPFRLFQLFSETIVSQGMDGIGNTPSLVTRPFDVHGHGIRNRDNQQDGGKERDGVASMPSLSQQQWHCPRAHGCPLPEADVRAKFS